MKFLVLFFIIISPIFGAEILKDEKLTSSVHISLVEYNGHTYIHLIDNWNHAANAFIHDPDCKKCEEKQRSNS